MFRKAFCFGLMALLLYTPLAADTGVTAAPSSPRASSTTKRVVWTRVGIGAGFAAGVYIGLSAFDDSINSDRKVWTSAIVGAAAGGLTAGRLSRNVGRGPREKSTGASSMPVNLVLTPWPAGGLSTSEDDEALRRRVRAIGAGAVGGSPR